MRVRGMAALLFAGGLAAARLGNDNHAPLVVLACDGFQDAGQLLELG
jgi:hypothetical protein